MVRREGRGKVGRGDKKNERSPRSETHKMSLDKSPGKCSCVFVTKCLLFKAFDL